MKTNAKEQLLKTLKNEFSRWEELLNGLNEKQVCKPLHPSLLSIKDEVAHLWTWQQYSIARAEAVLSAKDPVYPRWPEDQDPNSDDDLDKINAWIYKTTCDQTWVTVYQNWKKGFLHFLEIGEAVPEIDMFTVELYPWLDGYSFSQVLTGSCEHHEEHRVLIQNWLHEHGNGMSTG